MGILLIVLSAVYFLATSVQNAFYDVIDVTGLLFSVFYILTALATMVYYRRRIFSGPWDFLILGLLPLGAAGFLGWILVKSLLTAGSAELWSCVGILAAGVVLMLDRPVRVPVAVLPGSAGELRPGGRKARREPLAATRPGWPGRGHDRARGSPPGPPGLSVCQTETGDECGSDARRLAPLAGPALARRCRGRASQRYWSGFP